jgi:parallel beta-helix repeat protein
MRFSLLRKLFGRKNQPAPRRQPVRFRPQLEYLEARTLLSATIFVNAADAGALAQDGTALHPYGTIGQGVNAATNGDTVQVAAGTYAEQVIINKTITLDGAQAGVDARTRSGSESVATGTGNGGLTPFEVKANDVVINGFTVQGATNVNNVGGGVYIAPGVHGTQVLDNIIQDNIIGLFLANNSSVDQAVIQQNLFQNNTQSGPSSGTDIYADQYTAGSGGVQDVLIQRNTFTNSSFVENSWGIGMSNTDATHPFNNISVIDNGFSNTGRGMYLFATNNTTVTGNTFTGATHYAIGAFGAVNGVNIQHNTIQNSGAVDAALFVEDDLGTPGTPLPNSNITANQNNFVGDTPNVVISTVGTSTDGYTGTLDATNNWWGSPNGPAAGTIVGSVNVTPFLTNPVTPVVSPTSGPTAGGTAVTITGWDFLDATAVHFGSTPATPFTIVNDTTITLNSPAGNAGPVDVTVTTLNGTSFTSPADVFTYVAPPVVTGVVPNMGSTSGGTSVTISGSGFSGATAVFFGGNAATSFTVNSPTSITATTPPGTLGAVDVTVTTPYGTSTTGASDHFTYVAAGAPIVTSLSPNSGSTNGHNLVIVSGSGFTGATKVQFGTVRASYSVVSDTEIKAFAPPQSAGAVDVTVTTAGGTSGTSSADTYTYLAAGAPSVTGVNPSSGPLAGTNMVTISGTNFTGATAVSFGATAATSFTVNSPTSITAIAPAGTVGTVDVTVTTPVGVSATKPADQYTYVAAPTVTGVNPSNGSVGGNNTVTISGTGFTNATAVFFGANAATSFTVNSPTSITATVPASTGDAAGTVDVTVTTAGGTSGTSSLDQYTYVVLTPSITSVSPSSGYVGGGETVTISGSGFTGATAVKFGSNAATNIVVVNDNTITVTAPAGSLGTVDVTVTTPGGTSTTSSADDFTYVAAGTPIITSLSPNSGSTNGHNLVILYGSGFTGATKVYFGGVRAGYSVVSDNEIKVFAPPQSAGTVDVTVVNAVGTSVTGANDQYTYS